MPPYNYHKIMAESEGFEPPEPFGSTVFKTAAFDHSANSPHKIGHIYIPLYLQASDKALMYIKLIMEHIYE